ncbi:hypothetical protein [Chakrabartyella piscis]|uniref:hypothetical protein n=1 Tax=Chakrabartyella piscis TaxID=2918914 RepID=UPI002958BD03|nr:hypothetical protein [Chakrabartyella piscis]
MKKLVSIVLGFTMVMGIGRTTVFVDGESIAFKVYGIGDNNFNLSFSHIQTKMQ